MNQGHGTHNARLFFEVHVVVVEQIGLFRPRNSLYLDTKDSSLSQKTSSFILINQIEFDFFLPKIISRKRKECNIIHI